MGDPTSTRLSGSPYTVAAAAVRGTLGDPRDLLA